MISNICSKYILLTLHYNAFLYTLLTEYTTITRQIQYSHDKRRE